jgi:hypothetical protein
MVGELNTRWEGNQLTDGINEWGGAVEAGGNKVGH